MCITCQVHPDKRGIEVRDSKISLKSALLPRKFSHSCNLLGREFCQACAAPRVSYPKQKQKQYNYRIDLTRLHSSCSLSHIERRTAYPVVLTPLQFWVSSVGKLTHCSNQSRFANLVHSLLDR